MANKQCRHKRLILASVNMVEFFPDDEPYESGKIESCGIESITVGSINIHYCPKCGTVKDIEIEPTCSVDLISCEEETEVKND